MATMFRKAMLYLGLGPEEEYDDYDLREEEPPTRESHARESHARESHAREPRVREQAREPVGARARGGNGSYGGPPPAPPEDLSAIGIVRPINPQRQQQQYTADSSAITVQQPAVPSASRPRPQVVRPITATPHAKPHVLVPASFNQAQEVADKFKGNQPVIVNLQAADRDLARRLIDFASGLCYGLGGQMEKVANQVYLLSPTDVEVSAEERRRLEERGYDS